MTDTPLWRPHTSDVVHSQIMHFMHAIGPHLADYNDLWEWSIDNSGAFWDRVWESCGVIGEKGGQALINPDQMPGARFFPQARLNYAQNLLRRRDEASALVFRTEKGPDRLISFSELYVQVGQWAQAMRTLGLSKGDRVAGFMPNMPETIIAMLAAASLGAVWSSASPDFGVQGVVDRFGQIEPKLLISVDGYYYGGKTINCLEKIRDIQPRLPGLLKTVIVPYVSSSPELSGLTGAQTSGDFVAPYESSKTEITFEPVAFDHPLFIMYSSGTTGVPKCIVHGHGGTLLQHLKEHQLHCDIRRNDRVFYFTTCGWMMWNWLASALASEATLLLYDGSPFHPDGNVLWDFAAEHGCTFFGTSAKYIDTLKSQGVRPKDAFDLSSIRTISSTGSPLVHESFDYVYDAIKSDVHLASISGGTDIVSCFVLGNPVSPVWRGEIQGAGLGMAVNVFDEAGRPIPPGAGSGELVCTRPFPAMPVCFWNDPEGLKYHGAYFERFPNVWCHGDWIERTPHGGYIIHGRSDATLNPGGVRIGTAEIYRQVEQIPEIQESIAVGQEWESDVRVVLFVRMKPGCTLTDEIMANIRRRIREGASPRHVPAKIIAITDIPRTKNGKITELAVRDVIHGRPVRNVESLANPEALRLYENIESLRA